jgi:hypothetical protein
MKGFVITKKVKLPISTTLMRRIREYVSELVITYDTYRVISQRIVDEAVRYGYSGADVSAAVDFIGQVIRKASNEGRPR